MTAYPGDILFNGNRLVRILTGNAIISGPFTHLTPDYSDETIPLSTAIAIASTSTASLFSRENDAWQQLSITAIE